MALLDLISMSDFSREQIITILDVAAEIKRARHDPAAAKVFAIKYERPLPQLLQDFSVFTMFVEKSTRTNYSFRAAALQTGAHVDGFSNEDDTSLKKGETWGDTAAMFTGDGYDALVMRTKIEGTPRWTKEFLTANHALLQQQHQRLSMPYAYNVPMVLNGGDGQHEHPRQCLQDILTFREIAALKHIDLQGMDITLLNDLAHGRTNASIMSVAHLFDWKLHIAFPDRFGPQKRSLTLLEQRGVPIYNYGEDFAAAMAAAPIAYQSRPQKERVGLGEDLTRVKTVGQINRALYNRLGDHAPYLLHPKPVDAVTFEEINHDMINHPLNWTNMQAENGLYVSIALFALGLGRIPWPYQHEDITTTPLTIEELAIHNGKSGDRLQGMRSGYIRNQGIVLDHIPPGIADRLSGILGLRGVGLPVTLAEGLEVKDGRQSRKDMVKIHAPYSFTAQQYEAMALLAPDITISDVNEGKVTRKYRPRIGNMVTNLIDCCNDNCITRVHHEHVTPKHRVSHVNGTTFLECFYSGDIETLDEIRQRKGFRYINYG